MDITVKTSVKREKEIHLGRETLLKMLADAGVEIKADNTAGGLSGIEITINVPRWMTDGGKLDIDESNPVVIKWTETETSTAAPKKLMRDDSLIPPEFPPGGGRIPRSAMRPSQDE